MQDRQKAQNRTSDKTEEPSPCLINALGLNHLLICVKA